MIIIEQSATGFSTFSPDVPGCVATGGSRAMVKREMHDAIKFHLEGLREEGWPIPKASSSAEYVEVTLA